MTPTMQAVLTLLQGARSAVKADEVGKALDMTHEETYMALVALEGRGLARVNLDFSGNVHAPERHWIDV
jgi:hypothetical protein